MKPDECPISEIREAIKPYIRSRQEVVAIRQALHSHLESHLFLDNGEVLSAYNLTSVKVATDKSPEGELTGVRKAYVEALRAHHAARAKYEALKAEVRSMSSNEGPPSIESQETLPSKQLMLLLHQRERRRRLRIIKHALEDVEELSQHGRGQHLDDLIKERVGEQPAPPSINKGRATRHADTHSLMFDLKKAVLESKSTLDSMQGEQPSPMMAAQETHTPKAKLLALQHAHGVLARCIEDKLAIISKAESTNKAESGKDIPTLEGEESGKIMTSEDIQSMYQSYLTARERLTMIVSSTKSTSPSDANEVLQETGSRLDVNDTFVPAIAALAYILTLKSQKEEAAALMEQSTFVLRQLSTAKAEAAKLLARLAGESHLVHYAAVSGKEWKDAAAAAGRKTSDTISEHLRSGEASAKEAAKQLSDILHVSESMIMLKDDTI